MDRPIDTASLGARIRAIRSSRGMSQHQLANRSGISLRFVGQVESGRANASIARLAELAAGLEVSLVTLLAGLGPVHDPVDRLAERVLELSGEERERVLARVGLDRADKIALVGLRGAGKSTIGARAARRLGCPFVVVDELVRERSGLALADLFELHGTQGYHGVVREVLRERLDASGVAILEIGGSVVSDPESWALLSRRARVVWLRATAEAHLARVTAQGDTRPMQGYDDALHRLRELLREREPLYRRAHVTVDTLAEGVEGAAAIVAGLSAAGREARCGRDRAPSAGPGAR